MSENKVSSKAMSREEALEKEALRDYNAKFDGKVVPQNKTHNARKEAVYKDGNTDL